MLELTADQIIGRIANANGIEPTILRQQIALAIQNLIDDTTQPHAVMLSDLFPGGKPTVDEFVVALEYELYNAMMPGFSGWEWDGEGYLNTDLLKKTAARKIDITWELLLFYGKLASRIGLPVLFYFPLKATRHVLFNFITQPYRPCFHRPDRSSLP